MRLHDLRHACATFLLAAGVEPRTAMEILGHTTSQMTMERYGHTLPERLHAAAEAIDDFLRRTAVDTRRGAPLKRLGYTVGHITIIPAPPGRAKPDTRGSGGRPPGRHPTSAKPTRGRRAASEWRRGDLNP
ncbi:tyrosine-type recombinase/integrase [Frankia sp. R43]|uniref:tyrosine-type recombinase/integrase n=1 Tax=Frankia sp. R43 TaxID=269536 RepID=UPI0009FB5865|nr:tyrosine-type recombinase/integrase [Frankia sp. R43]